HARVTHRRHGAARMWDQRRGPRVPRPRRARAGETVSRRARASDADRMIVVFWDIDGTLLTTGRAGVPAWEQAVRETTGKDFALASTPVPGLTDYQIAVRTFEMLGVPVTADRLKRMVARYEELLPSTLPLKQGQVMPHVREILEALQGRPDVRSYLLTGNKRAGARAKRTHYDLAKYFPDGAFSEDPGIRASIATRALELARRSGPVDLQ